MALLLFVSVALAFGASLLAVLFPGTVVGSFGLPLNVFLAEALVRNSPVDLGSLVEREGGTYLLTLPGVLLVYLPVLGLLVLATRGR